MSIEKFPTTHAIAYRHAVAEWRKIMREAGVPTGAIDVAAEEMARYWLVINDVPERYSIPVEVPVGISEGEKAAISERVMAGAKAAIDPYVSALNYSKQVIYELVLQKHGVVLNYEPGMGD